MVDCGESSGESPLPMVAAFAAVGQPRSLCCCPLSFCFLLTLPFLFFLPVRLSDCCCGDTALLSSVASVVSIFACQILASGSFHRAPVADRSLTTILAFAVDSRQRFFFFFFFLFRLL